MKFERMQDIPTRSEFERNLNILKEQFKNEKLCFPKKDFPAIESLLKARALLNEGGIYLGATELCDRRIIIQSRASNPQNIKHNRFRLYDQS